VALVTRVAFAQQRPTLTGFGQTTAAIREQVASDAPCPAGVSVERAFRMILRAQG
jgi:hypothetical protein